jgi:UDP-glucose 4-epimerase
MKVLVTGGAGFLGSFLVDALMARGDEVTVLDDVSSGAEFKIVHHRNNPRFAFVRDTVLNRDILDDLISRCDLVYHLGAIVGVHHYVINPYAVLNVNVNGTQHVLQLAHKYGKKVLFASTSEIYGRNPKIPFAEDDERVLGSTTIDRWCYSTSKAVGEHFCFAYKKLGLKMAIVRFFNIYGPRMDKLDTGRVVTIFLAKILRNEPVTVVGDGTQTRSFTYIEDGVRGMMAAAERPQGEGEVFNIGSNAEVSIGDLAAMMIKLAGSKSTIKYVKQEDVYGPSYEDVPRRVPDIRKAKERLGFTATTPLEEGLQRTIEWFKAHG